MKFAGIPKNDEVPEMMSPVKFTYANAGRMFLAVLFSALLHGITVGAIHSGDTWFRSIPDKEKSESVIRMRPTPSSINSKVLPGANENRKLHLVSGEDRSGKKDWEPRFRRGFQRTIARRILRALRWLKRNQKQNGGWVIYRNPLSGSPSRSGSVTATGLATVAFLGAGYTPEMEPGRDRFGFSSTVARALKWLIQEQRNGGGWARPAEEHGRMANGVAALALAEAYQRTNASFLETPARKAVDRIVQRQRSQRKRTGKNQPGRLQGLYWETNALITATNSPLSVPDDAVRRAFQRLKSRHGDTKADTPVIINRLMVQGPSALDQVESTSVTAVAGKSGTSSKQISIPSDAGPFDLYARTLASKLVAGVKRNETSISRWKDWVRAISHHLGGAQNHHLGDPNDGSWSGNRSSSSSLLKHRIPRTTLNTITMELLVVTGAI